MRFFLSNLYCKIKNDTYEIFPVQYLYLKLQIEGNVIVFNPYKTLLTYPLSLSSPGFQTPRRPHQNVLQAGGTTRGSRHAEGDRQGDVESWEGHDAHPGETWRTETETEGWADEEVGGQEEGAGDDHEEQAQTGGKWCRWYMRFVQAKGLQWSLYATTSKLYPTQNPIKIEHTVPEL